jgi:hypothetical protein
LWVSEGFGAQTEREQSALWVWEGLEHREREVSLPPVGLGGVWRERQREGERQRERDKERGVRTLPLSKFLE